MCCTCNRSLTTQTHRCTLTHMQPLYSIEFITLHICPMQIHCFALFSTVMLESSNSFFFFHSLFHFISIEWNKSLKKILILNWNFAGASAIEGMCFFALLHQRYKLHFNIWTLNNDAFYVNIQCYFGFNILRTIFAFYGIVFHVKRLELILFKNCISFAP